MAAARIQRRRTPSFSSTLLDAVYRSIDDGAFPGEKSRNDDGPVEEEIESLRRAIRVEKWMMMMGHSEADYSSSSPSSRKLGNSAAATPMAKAKHHHHHHHQRHHRHHHHHRRHPISPGARIANFFNSIFTPRAAKTPTTTTTTAGDKFPKRLDALEVAGRVLMKKKKMDCFGGLSMRDHELGEVYGHDSDCSSDLFELDILSELPVYGTTKNHY